MSDDLENIYLSDKLQNQLLLEVRTNNKSILIFVNQKKSSLVLAKEILGTFRSIIPTTKQIFLDLSKTEDMNVSMYLTILNMALVSETNKYNFSIIIDNDINGVIDYYSLEDRINIDWDRCFKKLNSIIS